MSTMIRNDRLAEAAKGQHDFRPSEITNMAKEILANRKFIREKLAGKMEDIDVTLGTMVESCGTTYWVVIRNHRGKEITPYRTPVKENAEHEVEVWKEFFSKA